MTSFRTLLMAPLLLLAGCMVAPAKPLPVTDAPVEKVDRGIPTTYAVEVWDHGQRVIDQRFQDFPRGTSRQPLTTPSAALTLYVDFWGYSLWRNGRTEVWTSADGKQTLRLPGHGPSEMVTHRAGLPRPRGKVMMVGYRQVPREGLVEVEDSPFDYQVKITNCGTGESVISCDGSSSSSSIQ
jgi:hypothetical protein